MAAAWLGRRLRDDPLRHVVQTVAWLLGVGAVTWVLHAWLLGAFSYTVVNNHAHFVPRAMAIALGSAGLGASVHHALFRMGKRATTRTTHAQLLIVTLLFVLNGAHIIGFGWPLGFPLPSQSLRYLPFMGGFALFAHGLVLLGCCISSYARSRVQGR